MLNLLSSRLFVWLVGAIGTLLGVLTTTVAYAQAPTFNFAVRGVGTAGAGAARTVLDAAGNTYVIGTFEGRLTLGTTVLVSSGPNSEAFVAKLDVLGNYVWATHCGGTTGWTEGADLELDPSGNLVVTGTFTGATATFGNITLTNTPTPTWQVYVAKLSPGGQWLWAMQAGGAGNDYDAGVATDAAGNVYVTGTFNATSSTSIVNGTATFGTIQLTSAGYADVFVAKLNAAGQWLWAVRGGGQLNDQAADIATDPLGNVYMDGKFRSVTATFGSTTFTNFSTANSTDDVFVAKLTSAGTWLWAAQAGSSGGPSNLAGSGIPGDDWAGGLAVDGAGNVYFTGTFYGMQAVFGAFRLANSSASNAQQSGNANAFVAKLSPAGQFLWATQGDGAKNGGNALCLGPNSTVYCIGGYDSSTSATLFGNCIIPPVGDRGDAFIACLDSTGTWRWALGAGGNDGDNGNGIAANAAGGVVVCGGFYSTTIGFGPFTLRGNPNPNSPFGFFTPFIAHMQAGQPPALRTISPATAPAGGAAQLLTITGTGFEAGSVVRWRGQALATTYVSATELRATVLATAFATAGRYNVAVTTPFARGGSSSNALPVVVQGGLATRTGALAMPIIAYPNPSHGSVRLLLPAAVAPAGVLTAAISNALGQQVALHQFAGPAPGAADREATINGLTPGIYLVRVVVGAQVFTQKLVVD